MIVSSGLNSCKILAETLTRHFPGMICFGYVEGDTIVWSRQSDSFEIDVFAMGNKLSASSTTVRSIQENKLLTENIPRSVYGMRLSITAMPVINDAGEAVSSMFIAIPKLHPVAAAFDDFAPVLAKMFNEGALLYVTDLEKIIYREPSEKFDIPALSLGRELKAEDTPYKVIKAKEPIMTECDASVYGVPVYLANYPLLEPGNKNEVVGTLGLMLPKTTTVKLREMSGNLEDGLSNIASAIEQIAASATEIHTNEQSLHDSIKEIMAISEQINEVSDFIKEIADETKMLGLNAAIEAARAGDAGRGFGVVAEEIRSLSAQSKSTVPKIKELTDSIKKYVTEAVDKSVGSLHSSQEQAAATEEITTSIEEITAMSEELTTISQSL